MDRKNAKDLLHLRDWLDLAAVLRAAGEAAYRADPLAQEAGDALMMKIGEGARRLADAGFRSPPGISWPEAIANRNWIIHQYDEIDRAVTWATLDQDLPAWRLALTDLLRAASDMLGDAPDGSRE